MGESFKPDRENIPRQADVAPPSHFDESQFFNIEVDGQLIPARHGQTIAAALMAAGRRVFRRTRSGVPRGLFCGMGVCFECLVVVDGVEHRACVTPARPGMGVQLLTGEEGDNGDD